MHADDDLIEAQPQNLLMAIFGAYLQPHTAPVWSGGLVTALGYFGVAPTAARVALARLVQRGLAERHREGRFVNYTLSERCLHLLDDSEKRISKLGERSDPTVTWTLVWHTLPDSRKVERSNFVKQLRFHGFGQMQDGMWASPQDYVAEVADLVDTLGIGDAVTIFRAAPFGDVASGPLLGHLWDLDEVAERYRRFVDRYRDLTRPREMSPRQAFVTCTVMLEAFRAFANIDPELPELWSRHAGARKEAIVVFREALGWLKEPATAHFQELMRA
ncbi:PaaX family transcriptional regulator C-terminal domain-containing protein [Streptosporangium sp. NPDC051022]|uniref:PaaX family transcriptional regulator n=1 Tax=Streptosporangium sp. NPDC051022 TaxID=3155752 RepID=UPI003413D6F6